MGKRVSSVISDDERAGRGSDRYRNGDGEGMSATGQIKGARFVVDYSDVRSLPHLHKKKWRECWARERGGGERQGASTHLHLGHGLVRLLQSHDIDAPVRQVLYSPRHDR